MNEHTWLTCADPGRLLDFLRLQQPVAGWAEMHKRLTDRKLRLFACACCRQLWHLLTDPRSRQAVKVAERFADGLATDEEREGADEETAASDPPRFVGVTTCESLAANAANDTSWNCRLLIHGAGDAQDNAQAALLRHIIGDPFRNPLMPQEGPLPVELPGKACEGCYGSNERTPAGNGNWLIDDCPHCHGTGRIVTHPPEVLALATALYDGADCAHALCDALLDAGRPDLAEHFRCQRCSECNGTGETTWPSEDGGSPVLVCRPCDGAGRVGHKAHPKGCWALDLILGKK